MKFAKTCCILLALIISAALAMPIAFSAVIPVTIDDVKVNGDSLDPNDVNRVSVEMGEEIEVKVIVTAVQATDNVQVKAEITGYEHSDEASLSGKSRAFSANANTTYKKSFYLTLPADMEEDSYKLRVTVANRDDSEVTRNYNLKIEAPRHSVEVQDIMFMPGGYIEAGKPLLVSVRVKNMGDRDEDSVKVTASIPSLGISASDYIDEVEKGDAETSEQLFLLVPECAAPDTYNVFAEVEYNGGRDSAEESMPVTVVEGDSCHAEEDEEEADEEESSDGSEDGSDDEDAEEASDAEDFDEAASGANYSTPANSTSTANSTAGSADGSREEMLRKALEISLLVLIIALAAIGILAGLAGISAKER